MWIFLFVCSVWLFFFIWKVVSILSTNKGEEPKIIPPKKDGRTIREIYTDEYNKKLKEYMMSPSFDFTVVDLFWDKINSRYEMINVNNKNYYKNYYYIKFFFMWDEKKIKFKRGGSRYNGDLCWKVILFWVVTSVSEYLGKDREALSLITKGFRKRVIQLEKKQKLKKKIAELEARKKEDDEYSEKLRLLRELKPLDNDLKKTFDKATEIELDTKRLLVMSEALEQKRKEFYN